MSNYTEKTSGGQLNRLLTMLFGNKAEDVKVKYDNSCIGFYRIELPSVKDLYDALTVCRIDPNFVVIDDRWDRLTLWVCNYDGSDIDIEE